MEFVSGGVCAPLGFTANAISCGLRENSQRRDLALVVSELPAVASGVFSNAPQPGVCVRVSRENLQNHKAQAILCNSGIEHSDITEDLEVAQALCGLVSKHTGINADHVVLSSVGMLGKDLDLKKVSASISALYAGRSRNGSTAADAIITQDTYKKEAALTFDVGGAKCTLGAMAKGCSMKNSDMANLLCFLTTDVAITHELLDQAMNRAITQGFNMLSVERVACPNDMAVILANGLAENTPITTEGPEYDLFVEALEKTVAQICRLIAGDGEGATKLLECRITGAASQPEAARLAKAVATNVPVRRMLFLGETDAAAVLTALGPAATEATVELHSNYGSVTVARMGWPVDFDPEIADMIFMSKEIDIIVTLPEGSESATAGGCDMP